LVARGKQAGEDHAVALTAGQRLHRGHGALGSEQEALEVADHMPVVAVDAYIVGAVADDVGHAFFRIERFAQLAEIADLESVPWLTVPCWGWSLAEQDAQQGALAHAVVADQADAVATADLAGEVPEQRLVAVAVRDVFCGDHVAAGLLGGLDGHLRALLRCQALRILVAQLPPGVARGSGCGAAAP
jgi:hypothetical protein